MNKEEAIAEAYSRLGPAARKAVTIEKLRRETEKMEKEEKKVDPEEFMPEGDPEAKGNDIEKGRDELEAANERLREQVQDILRMESDEKMRDMLDSQVHGENLAAAFPWEINKGETTDEPPEMGIQDHLDQIHELLSIFEDRLSGVLRPEQPSDEKVKEGALVSMILGSLMSVESRLQHLLNRLERL